MSGAVLYRKYRPNSFAEVKGQDELIELIKFSILSDKIPQVLMFSGERGVGKTTVARLYAKAINCLNFSKHNDVCNKCENCKVFNDQQSIDIVELDAASNRGIDDIRNLRDSVNFQPAQLKYKVFIIDEAHMLTKEAFNALLKTLEEPPKHAVFILATTEPNKVPITILSRVQHYNFRLADEKDLLAKLKYICEEEGVKLEEEVLQLIYIYSQGSFRDAESLLTKIIALAATTESKLQVEEVYTFLGRTDRKFLIEVESAITSKDVGQLIKILQTVSKERYKYKNLANDLLISLRQGILLSGSKNDFVTLVQEKIKVISLLVKYTQEYKQIDDTMVMEALLMDLIKDNAVGHEIVTKPVLNTPPPVKTLEKPSKTKDESKTSKPSKDGAGFLSKVKTISVELWMLIKACKVDFDDNKANIQTTNDILYSQLLKPETAKVLDSLMAEMGLEGYNVSLDGSSGTMSNTTMVQSIL